jgi:hypothetical protein
MAGVSAVAPARAVDRKINSISIAVDPPATPQYKTVLDLKFDRPVNSKEVEGYVNSLRRSQSVAVSKIQLGPAYLSCGGSGNWSDSNGTLNLQYTCSTRDTIAWAFRISPAVQAIVVGTVFEEGLSWSVNGRAMPKNAPHPAAASYLFHGSMTGATRNSTIDYRDRLSFRHRVGPGGPAAITWSGRVQTLSD